MVVSVVNSQDKIQRWLSQQKVGLVREIRKLSRLDEIVILTLRDLLC